MSFDPTDPPFPSPHWPRRAAIAVKFNTHLLTGGALDHLLLQPPSCAQALR